MQPETLPHKANRIDLDPHRSVVNEYCQTRDVPKVFVVGSSLARAM